MLPVDPHPNDSTPPAGNDGIWVRAMLVQNFFSGEYMDANPAYVRYWFGSGHIYPPRPYDGEPPHFYTRNE